MANQAVSRGGVCLNLEQYLHLRVTAINQYLTTLCEENGPLSDVPVRLREAMNYSVMAGGKRIRPVLVLAAAESLKASWEHLIPMAAAVELIHTYSLIHDDLPAMDDDDFRRGMPTNHKVYGEAMAILAGDALLTHAFTIIARTGLEQGFEPRVVLQVILELSEAAGPAGMVGGQAMDLAAANPVIDDTTRPGSELVSHLQQIHRKKTAALIQAAIRIGGLLAGANFRQLEALSTYGLHLGLAFQIQDDLLDVTGQSATLGKEVGSDERAGKLTYPRLFGVERTAQLVHEHTEKAQQAIQDVDLNGKWLHEIANLLLHRLT